MGRVPRSTRAVRFGIFTADLQARELRKKGQHLKIQEQPYETLEVLLEQPGAVVTHEELRQRLWPEDTFVDFDHSLRTSILKLREILGDSATCPRYIETVPRRGYRFIAPVEFIETDGDRNPEDFPRVAAFVGGEVRRHWKAALAAAALIATLGVVFVQNFGGLRNRVFSHPRFQVHSLAVLPFLNVGPNNPQTKHLSYGLTGSLIDQLAQLPGLQVMGLNTVLRYQGALFDWRQAGRELKVDAVVTGRLRRHGDHLIVAAEMLDVARGALIWGGCVDRKISGPTNTQEEVAAAISQRIGLKLAGQAPGTSVRHYTPKARAYELYLKSRASAWSLNLDELPMGLRYARLAIQEDSHFALAYAALADIYATLGEYDLAPAAEVFPKAREAALQALELDYTLPGPHADLALVQLNFDRDWSGAEREIQRTLVLAPNRGDFHGLQVRFLLAMGRTQAALAEAQQAVKLDPFAQRQVLVMAYVHARRYDDAIREMKQLLKYQPHALPADLAYCYLFKGLYQKLFGVLDKSPRALGLGAEDIPPARRALRQGGKQALMDWLANRLEKKIGQGKCPGVFNLASINAEANHKDAAFYWLEKAYQEHSYTMLTLQTWPAWDALRSDSRFQDLLHRMHFPPVDPASK